MLEKFLQAIHEKRYLSVDFIAKEDNKIIALIFFIISPFLNVGRPPPTRMEIAAIDIYNVTEAVFSSVAISLFLRWLISSIINANRFSLSV